MKLFSYLANKLVILVWIVLGISACDQDQLLPVDDYYRFDKLGQLKMSTPPKLNYFLGVDTESIPLSVTLIENDGESISTPQETVSFYSNNEKLASESFVPNKAGTFNLVGKLAGKTSNTVQLKVWDPATLTIRISVNNRTSSEFSANGADSLKFKVELLSGTEVITGEVPLTLYANNIQFNGSFATTSQGEYTFTARGLGLVSNQVVLKAVAPTSYPIIRLPVIFHEVNRSQLTPARIKALTDGMTNAFRNNYNRLNRTKDENARDLFVEFYPATTDLDGSTLAVAGLDRVVSQKTSFEQEDTYTDSFNSFWDPTHYVNIWVYPNITGAYANSSWAYNPYVTQAMTGFSVLARGVKPFLPFGIFLNGSHLNLQDTEEILAHEAGHLLGLAHVFSGNGSNFNGCPTSDPDYCSDTRYYDRGKYSDNLSSAISERYRRTSCTGESYEANNFMDYYFSYNNSFTLEQLKRVRHAVNYGLWLPVPANGFNNGRLSGVKSLVERPEDLKYYKPVICERP